MTYIDSWGNEYKTEKELKAGILNILKTDFDYFEHLSEELEIPWEYFSWIVENADRKAEFFTKFKDNIEKAEEAWLDGYLCEADIIED